MQKNKWQFLNHFFISIPFYFNFFFLFHWIFGHVSKWNNNNNLHFKMHFRICGILSILCYAWNIFHLHFQRVIRQLDSWKCNIIEEIFWNWHVAFYFEHEKKTWDGEGTWVYLNCEMLSLYVLFDPRRERNVNTYMICITYQMVKCVVETLFIHIFI